MTKRLDYVDIFRGIPLLIMIIIQIFDYLSKSSIYLTKPYYVQVINSVTWVPPSLLFTFVSGMSVFLMIKSRLKKGFARKSVFWAVVKRYGKYVLISIPFTIFMWNLNTFLGWEEAIQGIGLSAIITALLLLLLSKRFRLGSRTCYLVLSILIVILSFAQSAAPHLIDGSPIGASFPRRIDFKNTSLNQFLISTLLNAFFRGWFSVINLLPLMLGGVMMISLIKNSSSHKRLFLFALLFISLSLALHLTGFPVDYYGRSFNLTFFGIGESALICAVAYLAYDKLKGKTFKSFFSVLRVVGLTAFFIYIAHYLLVLKVLELTGLKDLLNDFYAWLITVPLVLFMILLSKKYLSFRLKLPDYLRL